MLFHGILCLFFSFYHCCFHQVSYFTSSIFCICFIGVNVLIIMGERTVVMTGGGPWGFKMTGGKDFHQPLAIGKVKLCTPELQMCFGF